MLCVTSFSFSIINSTEFDHEHELLENNVENIILQNNHSLSHTLKLNKNDDNNEDNIDDGYFLR